MWSSKNQDVVLIGIDLVGWLGFGVFLRTLDTSSPEK